MGDLTGIKISPAALNRRSHATLAGSAVFVFMNKPFRCGQAAIDDVSVEWLDRYSSSWSSPDDCHFLRVKNLLSSSVDVAPRILRIGLQRISL